MLNKDLERTLNEAFVFARENKHEFMTVEHLLLALLNNPTAKEALEACSADIEAIRSELISVCQRHHSTNHGRRIRR